MLPPWASRLSLALGLLALAGGARAQVPVPAGLAEKWAFTATVGQFHVDNLLLITPDDPGDTVESVSVGLLYGKTGPRLSLSGYGRISGSHYQSFSQSSGITYGGGFGTYYRPSRTFGLSAGLSGNSGYYVPLLLGVGVWAPGTRVDSLLTSATGHWQATPRTLLRVDGEVGYLHYRSEVSNLDPSELPLDTLALAGVIPPEQAEIGIEGLPSPVDSSLAALRALSAEGVRRGTLDLMTYRAGLVLTQTLSPQLTLSIPLGFRTLDYKREGLRGGGQFDTGLSLRRSLGLSTSASLQYTYQRNSSQVPSVSTQTFLLQGEHEVSERLKLDASVGYGLTSADGGLGSSGSSWLGGAGISGRAHRARWDLRYGRSTYQALGFGRNYLTDYASALYERRLAKRLVVRLDARYRHSREALFGAYVFTSQYYGTNVAYRIQRRTVASAYYYFRRLDRPAKVNDVDSYLWGFSFAYGRSWKP